MFGVMLLSVGLMFPQTQGRQTPTDRAQPTAGGDRLDLDGNWTVLCFEKDGQPVEAAKNATVTFKDNMIKFEGKDGTSKVKSMRIEFDRPGHIRVTEMEPTSAGTSTTNRGTTASGSTDNHGAGKAESGVYVATKDYLAICLHDESAEHGSGTGTGTGTGRSGSGTGGTALGSGSQGSQGSQLSSSGFASSKTKCTVILKREGASR